MSGSISFHYIVLILSIEVYATHCLPSNILIDSQITQRKPTENCDVINRWGYQEEGKVWHDRCVHCHVCGAEEIGGKLLEAEQFCIHKTGDEICRGGCGCPEGYFRHNVTRTRDNTEVMVEICITSAECTRIISGVKCPRGQVWDHRPPLCTRTCENSVGLIKKILPCPKLWSPRCICPPEKPIWDGEKCIKLEDCPK